MLKKEPGQVRIVEEEGKFKVYYPIGTWVNGRKMWKERKKTVGTMQMALGWKERKEEELRVSVQAQDGPPPARFAKAVKGRTGATQEDWRVLLWAVSKLVADTPGDSDLNERAKVIANLASTAKKFLEHGEDMAALPTDKFDPRVVLEQLRWMVEKEEKRLATMEKPS